MMAEADGAVGVAPLALAVEKAVLVGVHNGAAPRGLHMVAEGDLVVADNQRRGAKVETVAKSEGAAFGDFDARACADGALAHDVEGAAEVEEGAMVAEVGHLAGVEPYLDEADTKAVGMEDDTPRKVVGLGAVGDKQGQTARLAEGQQAEIEPHAARKSERVAQEVEPFDAVPFVHALMCYCLPASFTFSRLRVTAVLMLRPSPFSSSS